MRRALKIAAWCIGTIAVLFIALLLLNWKYTRYFPQVWSATIAVDGRASRGSSLYRNSRTGDGLFVRWNTNGRELYAFGGADKKGFVFRCLNSSALVVPGLALSNHEQWAQGCLFQNLVLEDSAGNVIEKPKNSVRRNPRIGRHLLEFTADDGKRVKAEW